MFALSTIGLAMVLYLGWASSFVLKTWCPLCLGTYAAVIGLFVVSGIARSLPMARLPARFAADLRELSRTPPRLMVAILSLAIAALALGWFPREGASAAAASATGATSASSGRRRRTSTRSGPRSLGSISASRPTAPPSSS